MRHCILRREVIDMKYMMLIWKKNFLRNIDAGVTQSSCRFFFINPPRREYEFWRGLRLDIEQDQRELEREVEHLRHQEHLRKRKAPLGHSASASKRRGTGITTIQRSPCGIQNPTEKVRFMINASFNGAKRLS